MENKGKAVVARALHAPRNTLHLKDDEERQRKLNLPGNGNQS
jgi:hypothetical protein